VLSLTRVTNFRDPSGADAPALAARAHPRARRGRAPVALRKRRPSRAPVVLAIACILLAAATTALARQEDRREPQVQTGTVVWGGRVFSSRTDLAAWLHSRGFNYGRWAARHPRAASGQQHPEAPRLRRGDTSAFSRGMRVIVVALLAVAAWLIAPFRLRRR
jgi:hypothetical protein